jgi:glutamyl-tRNA synthetase/glutamyl-Q tRNA(Asp) synthetase
MPTETFGAVLRALADRLPPAPRTRYAPAPTGVLHLGHVVNAVLVWGVARALGGRVLLRLEDHDATRCRPAYAQAILDDLAWLGFEPDAGGSPAVVRQSDRGAVYETALARLEAAGLVYACACSRRSLAELAGHVPNIETPYPGVCRDLGLPHEHPAALRVRLPDDVVTFDDALLGVQRQHPAVQCGDVLLRDRLGQWTYQFAVVADDLAQQVDLIVRGRDLLDSTGRQLLLARLLGRTVPPVVLHHPLLVRADGRKLSKSDGATGIAELREAGWTAAGVVGLAAARAGLLPEPRELSVRVLPDVLMAAPLAPLRAEVQVAVATNSTVGASPEASEGPSTE